MNTFLLGVSVTTFLFTLLVPLIAHYYEAPVKDTPMFSPIYQVSCEFPHQAEIEGETLTVTDITVISATRPVMQQEVPVRHGVFQSESTSWPEPAGSFEIHLSSLDRPLLVVRPTMGLARAERARLIDQWHAVVDVDDPEEDDEELDDDED